MDANDLRRLFTGFFEERGHVRVPSASLIPNDPSLMFTVAGMVPFKPYFLGQESPPASRLTSVQKVIRTVDIELVGLTSRHLTFFEMLGNFSFGDYFKPEAIAMAYEFVTDTLGLERDRLWVTVHDHDDEAESIWVDEVGFPRDRIQRMGEDNFWKMGETGPCGPCSEIYYDKGPDHGEAGGPAHGGSDRYVEIWNLVFMQYNRLPDGQMVDLPRRNIDTGAGLERILPILVGTNSIFDTPVMIPMIEAACSVTGSHPGEDGPSDISLRILADHGRAISALIADGIFPSNEGRGYVLRRLIRRAVRHGQRLQRQPGESLILPVLCRAAIGTLGQEYQDMERSAGLIESVVGKEEERFLETLRSGMVILDDALAGSPKEIPGELVFRLHDTFGFPVELTAEVAAERGVVLDRAGFEAAMAEQKKRARKAGAASRAVSEVNDAYLAVLDATGPTEFVGYDTERAEASLVAAVPVEGGKANQVEYDLFLDRTPFYSEAGGQVGDRGVVTVGDARYRVIDTQAVLPGLVAHRARLVHGPVTVSGDAQAEVDHEFRQRTSRHHTATHLLHAALRQVLGDHVRQQGSLVTEDRLRFDFSHFQGATRDELEEVENRVNEQVLTNALVETRIMAKSDAEALGAIAFFGDKYGASVRVVIAGPSSMELCGGTHVGALGSVGLVRIVSEASIGSNTRRLEALAGSAALAHMAAERHHLLAAADLLGAPPDQLSSALGRLLERRRELENEVKEARRVALAAEAADLAGRTAGSVVVARRDGLSGDRLRELAVAVRERPGVSSVALAGSPDGRSVALAAAVTPGRSLATAGSAVAKAARLVGGGGGQGTEVAVAGGRDVSKIDDALEVMRAELAG